MIKFTALDRTANKMMVGLGLSDENIKLLKHNRPIKIDLKDLGITEPIEILIFHGKTEADIVQGLMQMVAINPTTTVFGVNQEDVPDNAATIEEGEEKDNDA